MTPRRWSRAARALLVATLAGAPLAAGAELVSGLNARELEHAGRIRSYDVFVPDGAPPAPALVVDLHGLTSTKEQQRALSGWQAKAAEEGFLVAWPDGIGNSWNGGVCCGVAVAEDVDDVGFVRTMVAAIANETAIDSTRVYVTGLSNGGALTHRLACEAADLFAAAAPLAFPTPYTDFEAGCQPARPIPVLASMGLTDVLVPYEGDPFASAADTFANWRARHACGPEPPESTPAFGGSFCEVDRSCAGQARVGLCSIRGSELTGPLAFVSGHILYLNDDALVMADLLWSFLVDDGVYFPVPEPEGGTLAAAALAALALVACRGPRTRVGRGSQPVRERADDQRRAGP